MKLRRDIFSFRNRVVVIVVGVVLGGLSLLYTNNMAQRLKEKEQHDVALWAHAMERVNREVLSGTIQTQDPLVEDLISNNNNIPFIITNQDLEVVNYSHLIPEEVIDHPDRLRRQIEKFTEDETSCVSDEDSGSITFRFSETPSHDAGLLLDSMILGLEEIEDSSEHEEYIDIIFKEV